MANSPRVQGPVPLLIAGILVLACWTAVVAGADGTIQSISVRMQGSPADDHDGEAVPFSILRARYELDVLGSVATGSLIQEFRNDGDRDLLATSTLRRPSSLKMRALKVEGGRRFERDAAFEAEKAPDEPGARKSGSKSRRSDPKLLESKPVSVAAGEIVTVRADFEMLLPLDEGRFVLRLPPVVAASDSGGRGPTGRLGQQRGRRPAAELREGSEPVPLAITVTVHHDEPLWYVDSPTHEILSSYQGDRTIVEPARLEITDGRPFELAFTLGSEHDATLLAYAGPDVDGGRKLVAVLSPPTKPWAETIRAKQVLFIMDSSGSMRGDKIVQARQGIVACLDKLTDDDLFNIVEFDHDFTLLSPEPLDLYSMTPRAADAWLEDIEAQGGTRLLPALRATFQQPPAEDHHRMVVILSDGNLEDDEKVLELLESDLGEGRLFVIGIGRDVKRESIQKMVDYGRGIAAFADDPESLEAAVVQLFDSVAAPLAWDLELDWGGAQLEAIQPRWLPDLYAGRTVMVIARVRGELPEVLTMRGLTKDGEQVWIGAVKSLDGGEHSPRMPDVKGPARRKSPKTREPDAIP